MKIIKPSAEYMEHDDNSYKFIEKVGRICYKSEDKITSDSAIKFVEGLVKRQHYAMLEHETLFFKVSLNFLEDFVGDLISENTDLLKYFNVSRLSNNSVISGSFRSFLDLFENITITSNPMEYMKYVLRIYFPTIFSKYYVKSEKVYASGTCSLIPRQVFVDYYKHYKEVLFKHLTHTVKFTCDRGVSHEFVRHRPCSFAQESTRYCNYYKDKFGEEITVIEPLFFERWVDEEHTCQSGQYWDWYSSCECAEKKYFELLKKGATPQEARSVLPNSLKTELVITTTEKEWSHIVDLRFRGTTGAPHPQMKEVMSLAIKDLVEKSDGRIVQ